MHLLEIRALRMVELPHSLMIEGRVAWALVNEQATGCLAILAAAEVECFLLEPANLLASE
jgi:hypothetical protein